MLISISILFLITQAPHIITTIIGNKTNFDNGSIEFEAGYYLLETVTKLLTYVNNVSNFFCYCISGKQFRHEVISMLRCGRGKFGLKPSVQTIETVSTGIES